jgi:DnaJ like chaperone protein
MSLLRRITRFFAPQPDRLGPEAANADPAFSAAVTALGAKLARADGVSVPVEYDRFVEAFPHDPEAQHQVGRFYSLAAQTTLGFEGYARRLSRRYGGCPGLLESVIDRLFHVAKADGAVTRDELDYLERVSELFGLGALRFRRLKAAHLGVKSDDPYEVIGVDPDASDDQLRAAWKKALSEHHPDRVAGQGLPPAAIEAAGAAASAINAAFDEIVRERRALAAAA